MSPVLAIFRLIWLNQYCMGSIHSYKKSRRYGVLNSKRLYRKRNWTECVTSLQQNTHRYWCNLMRSRFILKIYWMDSKIKSDSQISNPMVRYHIQWPSNSIVIYQIRWSDIQISLSDIKSDGQIFKYLGQYLIRWSDIKSDGQISNKMVRFQIRWSDIKSDGQITNPMVR